MTVGELLAEGAGTLRSAGVEDPVYDAREILKAAAGIGTADMIGMSQMKPSDIPGFDTGTYRRDIARRAAREPLQHILGTAGFMDFSVRVDRSVLIPRPETETLAETVLARETSRDISVLDLGTGSGVIAIALKRLGGYRLVAASDIEREALTLAKDNAGELGADIEFYASDLFSSIDGQFDVIVSNPPYIATGEIETLMPEVKDFDPRIALDGGDDGLGFYRRIAGEAAGVLRAGGRIYLELGIGEAPGVREIFSAAGYKDIMITRDMAGIERVMSLNKGV